MVRIRMKRMGRRHRPFYRINAIEKRNQRDGVVLENLGWYDPIQKDEAKQLSLKVDRIKHWLSQGAQPSDVVSDILAKQNIIDPAKRESDRQRRFGKKIAKINADKAAAASAGGEAKAEG